MVYTVKELLYLFCIVPAILVLSFGCASDKALQKEITDINSQMIEMQKSIADTNMRMEEMNNSIFILQEMAKANKDEINKIKRPTITIQGGSVDGAIPPGLDSDRGIQMNTIPLPLGEGGVLESNGAPRGKEFASALESYNKGNYGLAVFDFSGFISKNPGSPDLEQALYYLGMSYFNLNEFALSIREWRKLLNKFPRGRRSAETAYRIGVAYNTLGQIDKGKNYFDLVIQNYAGSQWAKKASDALK